MSTNSNDIERVLFATYIARTPAKIRDALLDPATLTSQINELEDSVAIQVQREAHRLVEDHIGVLAAHDSTGFPEPLIRRGKAIVPALFYRGNPALLSSTLLAVSGSRKVTERGAAAAARLGEIVAQAGLALVSGNARGVDTVASTAALGRGGQSILVLPEGIAQYRREIGENNHSAGANSLVLSQFPPGQPWTVHGAMGRNRVICALAPTVVVVEAGESGGSLAAGREALRLKRSLLAFTYGEHTPPGNKILISEGAVAISSPEALSEYLEDVSGGEGEAPSLSSSDAPITQQQGSLDDLL